MNITKNTANNKKELLKYYRDRSVEYLSEFDADFGKTEYKKKSKKIIRLLI